MSFYGGLVMDLQQIRHQGKLNLSTEQFQRMMNIVHLEGVICGLNRAKKSYKDTKLSELTGSVPPDVLLQEMVQGVG